MALTKFNYNSFDVTPVASKAMGFNSDADGLTTIGPTSMVLIKTVTASSDSAITLVDGTSDVVLDNTYPVYLFKFFNVHPATDNVNLQVNFRDGGSSYDATKTSTAFYAHQGESDDTGFGYGGSVDLQQATGIQPLLGALGNGNDESTSGELWLFNPSSTTFVKHYMVTTQYYHRNNYSQIYYVAGYCNVTAAIDGVQFKMNSGDIDSGTFKLYGIKDS